MKILGVDPGSVRTGYGLIIDRPRLQLVTKGVITSQKRQLAEKIITIAHGYQQLLERYRPDVVAIEKIYFYKNVKTALEVAQARGALVLVTAQQDIPLREYTPLQIKQTVTNYGRADKRAVAKMVVALLGIQPLRGLDDESDALAIAITAAHLIPLDEH